MMAFYILTDLTHILLPFHWQSLALYQLTECQKTELDAGDCTGDSSGICHMTLENMNELAEADDHDIWKCNSHCEKSEHL